ncbi:cytochrome o ubiquinol oxidase subunit III [Comamonas serinivorans]|uniref:Cytochrome bo(3) ubiquinol oxidase subunit 3 n=1 Tax=Comamonas serinivorans TaxID=1082851 RepID=A0A1Y0EPL7_9BURK|nr:cytochrome o ubiquinol oxidase subunit III [Comamonas serinivorans]ARU05351.1 cytochrome o ubiquinol oxidase subunit III [Comamonas serinivorans]
MSNPHLNAGGTAALATREYHLAHEPHPENGTALGFWLYLMSDCLIFASLFATWGVLGRNFAGGPNGAELFDLTLVALNTAFLLLSSITFGFAMLRKQVNDKGGTLLWLAITGFFGLCFLAVELYEFHHLIHVGAGPQSSAAMSAFFALVGTHGLHVTFGLIWLVVLMIQISKHGLIHENKRRLMCLSMFWHFLDVVWIGVFTFVYLMGVL